MKLYFSKGACSLAVRIVCNELGLKVIYEEVNLKAKKTSSGEDYYKINPKGSVPALQFDDGKVLTENSAIQQFLADSNNATELLPPIGDFARYRVLEWLGYVNSDVHKSFGPLFNPNVSAELKQNLFIPLLKSKLDFINKNLEQKKYLTGDHFTLPDGYLFVTLRWLAAFKMDTTPWPNLHRYFEELKSRASIQKSLEQEGLEQ